MVGRKGKQLYLADSGRGHERVVTREFSAGKPLPQIPKQASALLRKVKAVDVSGNVQSQSRKPLSCS